MIRIDLDVLGDALPTEPLPLGRRVSLTLPDGRFKNDCSIGPAIHTPCRVPMEPVTARYPAVTRSVRRGRARGIEEGRAIDQKQVLLERVPLFSGVSGPGLEELGGIADEIDVRAGTILTREGYREGFFFVIVSGTVRIERGCRTLNTLGPGDFLGEIALLDGGPRTATATAETPCRVLSMTYQMFHELLDASPSIRAAIMEAVGARLRALEVDAAI